MGYSTGRKNSLSGLKQSGGKQEGPGVPLGPLQTTNPNAKTPEASGF